MGQGRGGQEREIGSNTRKNKGVNGHGFCAETSFGVFQRQICRNLLVSFRVGFSLILSSSLGWDSFQEEPTNTPDFRQWLRKSQQYRSIGDCGRWTDDSMGLGEAQALHLGFLK